MHTNLFRIYVNMMSSKRCDFLKLTHDKLDVGEISDLVVDGSCGAVSLFVGTTRDNFENKKVETLTYEAYEPMAQKEMKKICEKLRISYPDIVKIAIYHRLGIVPVCDASVVIAISSPHRKSSLAAVSTAIDELKKSVPIWKKETYSNDESVWKENNECEWLENKNKCFSIKRIKQSKIDFSECSFEEESVPQNLVQIAADEAEITRRIHCFVEKKREEIDMNNILDYTEVRPKNEIREEISFCARTNSVMVKQDDSNCHLRVRRVKNRIGPQVKPDYLHTLDMLMSDNRVDETKVKFKPYHNLPVGLEERLLNIENHLNLGSVGYKHIYERIKSMEDKILFLESISPEYKHFLIDKMPSSSQNISPTSEPVMTRVKQTFTADELDWAISQVQQRQSSIAYEEENNLKVLKAESIS